MHPPVFRHIPLLAVPVTRTVRRNYGTQAVVGTHRVNVLQGPQPLVDLGLTQMQMVIEWPLQPSQSIYTQLLGVIFQIEVSSECYAHREHVILY